MARSALLAGLGVLVLASLGLVGCANSSETPASEEPTSQASLSPDPDLGAAWLDNGRIIGLVTLGSSTCAPVADTPTLNDEGVLEVTLTQPDATKPCTRDLVPRATLVTVPEGIDPALDLQIKVTGENDYYGEVELPGVAGLLPGGETDYRPSAGWATANGQFVILTWGSSTCVPVIEDVKATSPSVVTITFAMADSNQVCTADIAPQAQVTAVNGLQDDAGITAILTGGGYNNVKIPIYGTNS